MCAAAPRHGDPVPRAIPTSFTTGPGPLGTRFGPVRRFTRIDSTNRDLLDEARQGAPEGVVAVADYQSAGRGRLGRRWEAPPGANLLASVLLRPAFDVTELHLCTAAMALAAARACGRGAGVSPELKWPNDLMVGGRKLGGILAEAVPTESGRAGPAVVVGLGLNIGWPAPDADATGDVDRALDDELLVAATSIWRETGSRPEPIALLGLVLEELETTLVELDDHDGRRRLAQEYRLRCGTIGRQVRVSLSGEVLVGVATDITGAGHLVVDVGTGTRTVAAGDVVHLRDPS
jgi:BirA family transcriptional regulator, biotin operon repressor / biotin---[acetyl-CoA-carboxylase] ligase